MFRIPPAAFHATHIDNFSSSVSISGFNFKVHFSTESSQLWTSGNHAFVDAAHNSASGGPEIIPIFQFVNDNDNLK